MKYLILEILRSLKNNIFIFVSLIILVFMSTGVFTLVTNISKDINSSFSTISEKGNLHDIVVNEKYPSVEKQKEFYQMLDNKYVDPETGKTTGFGLEPNSWYEHKSIDILTSPDEKLYKLIENTPNQPVDKVVISQGLPIQPSMDIVSVFPVLDKMYYGYSMPNDASIYNYSEEINYPFMATSTNGGPWTITNYNPETDAKNVAEVIEAARIMRNATYSTAGAESLYKNFQYLTEYNFKSPEWLSAYVKLARGTDSPVNVYYGFNDRSIPPKLYGYDNPEDAKGDPQIVIEYTRGTSLIDQARTLGLTDPSAYAITVHPAFATANKKVNASEQMWKDFMAMDGNQRSAYLNKLANEGSEYLLSISGTKFLITGIGTSPDFMHPIFNPAFITPIFAEQAILYGNTAAYNRLAETERAAPIEKYIVIKNTSKQSDEQLTEAINKWAYHNMNWPSNIAPAALATDTTNMLNISASRIVFVNEFITSITAISTSLVIFLSVLASIIVIVIISKLIANLKFALGVCKANGIKTPQIFGALMIIPVFISILGCLPGYLIGVLAQQFGLSLFEAFWTIPTPLVQIDVATIFITIAVPIALMMLMVMWITYRTFRVSNVELLKEGSEYKLNFISRGFKALFAHASTMTNFRLSFATNSLWKLTLLTFMTAATISSLTILQTVENQFEVSKEKTFATKDYNYMIDLTTPTIQGGLHYPVSNQSWVSGKTTLTDSGGNPIYVPDPNMLFSQGIDPDRNVYDPLFREYLNISKDAGTRSYDYNAEFLAMNVDGKIEYFNNAFIAGAASANNTVKDIQFNRYRIQSMPLIDHVFSGMNAWDIGVGIMPETTAQKFSNAQNIFLEYANDPANGYQIQYYIRKNVISGEYVFAQNPFSDPAANDLELDPADTGLNSSNIGTLTKEFVDALFEVYNSPYFTQSNNSDASKRSDFRVTNQTIFVDSKDQFFTYVEGTKHDSDKDNAIVQVIGLNDKYGKESYIDIYDSKGKNLNIELNNYIAKDGIYPIAVNEVSASKYDYKVGDIINFDVSNTTDRFTKLANKSEETKTVKFEVIGINEARYDYEYYTSQKYANEIIGLTSENFNGANSQLLYNGVLTAQTTPSLLATTFPLYSPSGLAPGSDRWNKDMLINNVLIHPDLLNYTIEQTGLNKAAIEAMPGGLTGENIYNELVRVYSPNIYYSSLNNVSSMLINKTIFDQTLDTSTLFFDIIVGVVIPVTFLIVLLIVTLIIADVKRLSAMLKALGMSDTNNSNSFLGIYIPVLLLAMAISIPLSMALFELFKSYVLSASNILLFGSISWIGLLISVLGIGIIFGLSYLVAFYSMRKIDLIEELKS